MLDSRGIFQTVITEDPLQTLDDFSHQLVAFHQSRRLPAP
jgi:hypothetical protein